jgi:hypothetical protein
MRDLRELVRSLKNPKSRTRRCINLRQVSHGQIKDMLEKSWYQKATNKA